VAVEKTDKSSLTARLASPEAFKGAGIDYPYALPKLKFHVETRANGEAYIKATSEQPVNEPFVSLLIELGWSSGRLLREYTFLLDPPGFVAEQPAAAAVAPIEPVVVAPVIASVPVPASAPQAEPVPQMVAEPQAAASAVPATAPQAVAEAVPAAVADAAKPAEPVATADVPPANEEVKEVASAPAMSKTESSHAAAGSITVKRGDTLSKIANQTKSADVSLERMLVALYRANTGAFEGKNMNRLSTGKILRLPETEELAKLQQPEAAAEVRVQVADWNAYRQKLAAANAPATDQRAKQEVAGKISTSIAEKTPDAKEPAKEVLKLSKGEAPGDTAAAGGKAKSAKEKAIAKEEDAIAKTKALKEAEQRTAMLEKSVKDMQRLVELKNQAAAAKVGQDKPGAAATAPAVVPLVASAVAATSEVAAAKPKPKAIAPKVVTPPPSLIDDILGNPVYLGGGAAVLLGLGGLVFMRTRRTKTDNKKVVSSGEEVGSATGRIAAPVMPSPETGDFTNAAVSTAMAANVDEVDPIGEADMFLNFGRDVQAEEVLKDALHKDPSNIPVKLKLLSIYATRKDTKSFYIYALEIKQSGDEAAWEQAAAMGRTLEPNNALYGGSGDEASAPAAPSEEAALPAVDFDLGFGGKEAEQSVATFEMPVEVEVEPDAAMGEKTLIMSASELRAAQEAPMDFDVTGTHPGIKSAALEEPKLDLAAMDFDVTVQPSAPAIAAEIPAEETSALNLDDLVFDVTSTHQAKGAPDAVEAAPAVEADQGMAFTIDFPTEAKPEATAQSAAPVKDVGLSEISLSLDGVEAPAAPTASVPKGEQWQEVATKLDLAKAYQEMGDQDGAREILEEVMRDGDESQRETAQALLAQLV
jgi:pilus assembly protein FimV